MAEPTDLRMPEVGLQSAEHEELLNIIDTLRSQGISRYVDLPQLIVCGDQSSGKSNVLEAISSLRWPTKDALCTRFATELVLRRGPVAQVTVTITPGPDRTKEVSEALASFKPPSKSIDDFAAIVNAAEKAMGLDDSKKLFSKDILKVELCGPCQPHLTLVDLPGIFYAGNQAQSDDDATLVRDLVKSYMRKAKDSTGQIQVELPSLVRDVDQELESCKGRLEALGGPRGTLTEQRMYLLKASQTFSKLIRSAVDGTYDDGFFGTSESTTGYKKRLRAVVQRTMTDFADKMEREGHAQQIVDSKPSRQASTVRPQLLLRDKYLEQVTYQMRRNRGRELPGLFNPSIIGDLFFEQAKPWLHIVNEVTAKLIDATWETVELVLDKAADSVTKEGIMRYAIRPNMEPICGKLLVKAEEVLLPHRKGHPLTFNHYFTENLQQKRQAENRKFAYEKIRAFLNVDLTSENTWVSHHSFDAKVLCDTLIPGTEQDMDRFAATEATNAMEAYYKVALKSVIDAFGMYAVEACLLAGLPDIFMPEIVYQLDDETVTRIAGESTDTVVEREDLQKKFKVLDETMVTLRRLKTFTSSA